VATHDFFAKITSPTTANISAKKTNSHFIINGKLLLLQISQIITNEKIQTRKTLGQRRPPPSILIQHNIVVLFYAPFKAMLTKISK